MDQPAQSTKAIKEPGKKRRRRKGGFNLLLFIGIIAAIGLFAWAETQRRDAISRLQQTEAELAEIRESTQRSGQDVANEVIGKVRALIDVPEDPTPTVATIIDVDRLRETSDFYQKAENGDHLIITETRAILFDPDRNIIIDVVPVSINAQDQADAGTPAEGETPTPTPTDTPIPTPETTATPDPANQ